jgi:bifunctional DNase/RNase
MSRPSGWISAFALAALMLVCGCSHRHAARVQSIRVEVARVGMDPGGEPFVLLQQRGGERLLPITVDESQARAIAMELHGISPGRPLTYDLMRVLLQSTGNRVDRVTVNALHDEVYYARISLDHGRVQVDSRPSDAIALALAAKAPIYVLSSVFDNGEETGAPLRSRLPEVEHGLGLTVQDLSPTMAPYFKAPPGSAVVVADESTAARNYGIARGDLLTAVGTTPIHDIKEFKRALAKLSATDDVPITIRRGDSQQQVKLRAAGS